MEAPPPRPDWVNEDGTVNHSEAPAGMFGPPPGHPPGNPDLTERRWIEVGDDGELMEVVDLSDEETGESGRD